METIKMRFKIQTKNLNYDAVGVPTKVAAIPIKRAFSCY